MLKPTLICSAVISAFLLGGHVSTEPMQDQAVAKKKVEPISLYEALRGKVGRDCIAASNTNSWNLHFDPAEVGSRGSVRLGSDDRAGPGAAVWR